MQTIPPLETNTRPVFTLPMFITPRITRQQIALFSSPPFNALAFPLTAPSVRPTVQRAQCYKTILRNKPTLNFTNLWNSQSQSKTADICKCPSLGHKCRVPSTTAGTGIPVYRAASNSRPASRPCSSICHSHTSRDHCTWDLSNRLKTHHTISWNPS